MEHKEWTIISSEILKADKNNFIEVSLKHPPLSEEKLIAISKGWFTPEGEKRYKTNILMSLDQKKELVKLLEKIN